MKPKLVILTTGFYPYAYGGLSTQTFEFSSFVQSKGYPVTVISQKPGVSFEVSHEGAVEIIFVPLKSKSKFSSLVFIVMCLLHIFRIKYKNPEEPMIVHSMQFLRSSCAAGLSKAFGVQVASTWVAGEELSFSRLPLRLCAKLLDLVIVQKREDLKFLRSFYHLEDKVFLLRGGVNDAVFVGDIQQKVDNIIENLRKNHLNLIWVGRVAPEKDPLSVLRACKLLKERDVGFELKIIGSGELLQTVIQKAEDLEIGKNVRVLGYLPWSKTIEEIRGSDILVISSLSEGLPNVLGEAMATGALIVATPVGATKDVIVDKQSGFVFPCGRYDLLADVLEALTSCPPFVVQRIIHNARALAELKLKGSDIYQTFLDLFLRTLKSNCTR